MEILNFESVPGGSYEIATFDIDFGEKWGMILRRFKLCKSKSGKVYFQSSSFKKSDIGPTGKPDWRKYVDLYGDRATVFNASVMELLQPYMSNLGIQSNPDSYDYKESIPF